MPTLSNPLLFSPPHLSPIAVLDILVVAFLIYQFLMIIRGRRAARVLIGIIVLMVIYVVVTAARLELVRATLAALAPYAPIALIVIFQSEIRRLLARIGGRRWITIGGRLQKREFSEELVLALTQLSQQRVGALVVIERDIGLRSFIESGVLMEAFLSRDLLLTVFHPGSPLHDGAVIIQGDRIAAAACFLPLTVKPAIARQLGTRHRAAIGVTEETDALALVVSEETGRISVAAFGDIEMDVSTERLEARIAEHLIRRRSAHPARSSATPDRDRVSESQGGAHAD